MKTLIVVVFALVVSASCASNAAADVDSSEAPTLESGSGLLIESPGVGSDDAAPSSGLDIRCESRRYLRNKCFVGFIIGEAELKEQLSKKSPCIKGVTWTYKEDHLKVSWGCRGIFHVTPKAQ